MKTLLCLCSMSLAVLSLSGCGGRAEVYGGTMIRTEHRLTGDLSVTRTEGEALWVLVSDTSLDVMIDELTVSFERVAGPAGEYELGSTPTYRRSSGNSELAAKNDPDYVTQLKLERAQASLHNGLLEFEVSGALASSSLSDSLVMPRGTLEFSFTGLKR